MAFLRVASQMSYGASSERLGDTVAYPRFMRTVASDTVKTDALCSFWKLEQVTNAAVRATTSSTGRSKLQR
eukprot:6179887-Pleurochrysis_carterae.AAC.8